MKRTPLINQPVAEVIAGMGHFDTLVVADAGLPIPPGVRRIDLAYAPGKPPFLDVLRAVLGELLVEEAIVASEIAEESPQMMAGLKQTLGEQVPIGMIPHVEFKRETAKAVAVIRTGEFTHYSNVILVAGVVF